MSGGTLASTFVFGSGPECPNEPYCLPGLESTYGLMFEQGEREADHRRAHRPQQRGRDRRRERGGRGGEVPRRQRAGSAGRDFDATPPSDPAAAHEALCEELSETGLVALQPAPAEDKNGIVVTAATASRYGLVKVSDLGKPAP